MKVKHVILTLFGVAAGAAGAYVAAQAYREARAKCPPFRRRTYRKSSELIDDFRYFWQDPGVLADMRANTRISPAFGEKLMLAVTGVTGCRYCSRLHAHTAEAMGISSTEAASLLRGEMASATVEEAPALFFAQHYAERQAQPDPELVQRLVQSYDERTARDIMNHLRLFSMANLLGNTVDALVSRALGKPAPDSSLRDELSIVGVGLLGIGPLVPVLAVRAALRGIVRL